MNASATLTRAFGNRVLLPGDHEPVSEGGTVFVTGIARVGGLSAVIAIANVLQPRVPK
jgi:hypothetical protein